MIIRVRYNYVRLFLCLNKKVLPIFGVIQTGGYRGGWHLDVRIMDV